MDTTLLALRQASILLDRLAAAVQQLRSLADQLHGATSDLQALQQAHKVVAAERDHLAGRLNALIVRLDALVPRADQQRTDATVVAKPLDAVFVELLALAPQATENETSKVLIPAVDYVTARGLAEITAATPPRLEAVAANIANHRGVMSPPWGGKPRMLDGHVIHVLPPLSPENGDKVTEMIKAHDPDSTVAVAPQMPASLNCTTLFIATVADLDEVFTQYLKSGLLDAYNDPRREMIFAEGTAASMTWASRSRADKYILPAITSQKGLVMTTPPPRSTLSPRYPPDRTLCGLRL